MTTIRVGQSSIAAEVHAGNRDACVSVTATLRTFAHALDALGWLDVVEQREEPPRFRVSWTAATSSRLLGEIVWLLEQLLAYYPEHLRIERCDAVRHDGNGLRQGA
ncbi:MAG TPA: hypothetical protein VFA29_07825 [Candidatus Baltobacteraceae bacterium]|nr:hypothetical protein [Candidatus Baltobacteraceae bacterium]